jgi:hypothetical protein
VPAFWSTEIMSVVLGNGSAEEPMFGVSGFGLTEQPLMRIDEAQALNMIKEVLTLHLLYRAILPLLHAQRAEAVR